MYEFIQIWVLKVKNCPNKMTIDPIIPTYQL